MGEPANVQNSFGLFSGMKVCGVDGRIYDLACDRKFGIDKGLGEVGVTDKSIATRF
jgi:hypothetical protein